MTKPIVIGIDAGGTLTDTILVDPRGHFTIGKAATTPQDEAEGFIASAEDAADAWGIALDDLFSGLDVVLHSGTGMLNTLLSSTGRRLGLITTKGLEDMILMGRGLQAWSDYSYSDRSHAVTHGGTEVVQEPTWIVVRSIDREPADCRSFGQQAGGILAQQGSLPEPGRGGNDHQPTSRACGQRRIQIGSWQYVRAWRRNATLCINQQQTPLQKRQPRLPDPSTDFRVGRTSSHPANRF